MTRGHGIGNSDSVSCVGLTCAQRICKKINSSLYLNIKNSIVNKAVQVIHNKYFFYSIYINLLSMYTVHTVISELVNMYLGIS